MPEENISSGENLAEETVQPEVPSGPLDFRDPDEADAQILAEMQNASIKSSEASEPETEETAEVDQSNEEEVVAETETEVASSVEPKADDSDSEYEYEYVDDDDEPAKRIDVPDTFEMNENDSAYIDEDLAKVTRNLMNQIEELRSELDGKQSLEAVNRQFEGLGKAYKGVFGSGIEVSEEAAKNRTKLVEAVGVLRSGYEANGKKAPADSKLFEKALRMEFGDIEINQERQSMGKSIRKRESQLIARPSARQSSELNPTDRAVRAIHAKMLEEDLYSE